MSIPRRPGARFGGKRKVIKSPDARLREFASKVSPPPTSILATAHAPCAIKRPSPTGAIVSGTDPCTCGHSPEDHGREPAFPSSTECRECEDGDGGPGCIAYEANPDE